MSRLLLSAVGALLAFTLVGCNDAKKLVAETKEGYRVLEEVAGHVADMSASLRTNDFAKAKEFGAKADRLLSTRTFSWSIQLLATEETNGVDAAKALIARFKAAEGITADERAALAELEKYFQRKGKAKTGDIIFLVAAVTVEGKYGHGAGGVLLRARETYRKSALPAPALATNQPAQEPR